MTSTKSQALVLLEEPEENDTAFLTQLSNREAVLGMANGTVGVLYVLLKAVQVVKELQEDA